MEQIVEASFKEYDTLREEVLQSITHRTQIISFGFGGIASFATGALLVKLPTNDPTLSVVIFAGVIPIVSVVFCLLWFSELMRMFRASNHLVGLEKQINEALPRETLSWERSLLRDNQGENRRHQWYMLVILMFGSLAIAAPLLGLAVTDFEDPGPAGYIRYWWVWVLWIAISVVGSTHLVRWAERERRGPLHEGD
jgi:hypothetical protein